ncbi:hypothetical protein RhiirA4_392049, partial [Rhizophagus irregularis]
MQALKACLEHQYMEKGREKKEEKGKGKEKKRKKRPNYKKESGLHSKKMNEEEECPDM